MPKDEICDEFRRSIAAGEVSLGPGTITLFFPLLLPYDCCSWLPPGRRGSVQRRCYVCGHGGWTHNVFWPEAAFRCLDCQSFLAPAVAQALRRNVDASATENADA